MLKSCNGPWWRWDYDTYTCLRELAMDDLEDPGSLSKSNSMDNGLQHGGYRSVGLDKNSVRA